MNVLKLGGSGEFIAEPDLVLGLGSVLDIVIIWRSQTACSFAR